jgi:hypothetical protein
VQCDIFDAPGDYDHFPAHPGQLQAAAGYGDLPIAYPDPDLLTAIAADTPMIFYEHPPMSRNFHQWLSRHRLRTPGKLLPELFSPCTAVAHGVTSFFFQAYALSVMIFPRGT